MMAMDATRGAFGSGDRRQWFSLDLDKSVAQIRSSQIHSPTCRRLTTHEQLARQAGSRHHFYSGYPP